MQTIEQIWYYIDSEVEDWWQTISYGVIGGMVVGLVFGPVFYIAKLLGY